MILEGNIMSKNTTSAIISKKPVAIALLCGILGLLLLIIGNCRSGSEKEETDVIEALDPAKYAREVEERVEALCNKVDGVSSSFAVVSLEGGYRAVYATDSQAGSSSAKKQTVTLGSGSGERALLIGYENPRISGIGIVCSGGDDPLRRKEIIAVISSAFDLPTNKIFVTGS